VFEVKSILTADELCDFCQWRLFLAVSTRMFGTVLECQQQKCDQANVEMQRSFKRNAKKTRAEYFVRACRFPVSCEYGLNSMQQLAKL